MTSSIQPNIQQVLDKVEMKQIFRKLDGFCSICRQDHNGRKMDGRDILKVASRETACLLLKQILCCAFESKVLQILMKTLICRKVLSTASIKEKASPCVGWLVQVSMLCKSSLIPGPSLTLANWSLRCSQCSQTNNRN